MTRVRGVLLDIDGTLVDSNDAHARAWVDALAGQGLDVPFAQVRRLIGMGGDKLLPKVSGISADSARGRAILDRRLQIFCKRYLPSLQAFPGARELLGRMHKAGLRMVVASSAKQKELDGLLRICGADEVIEHQTSSDDADRSKPDPDIIQAALEKLGLPRAEVILLGDTPYDLEAAGRAGIPMIALRCGGWRDTDFAEALAVYDDPADLLAQYESSPLSAGERGGVSAPGAPNADATGLAAT